MRCASHIVPACCWDAAAAAVVAVTEAWLQERAVEADPHSAACLDSPCHCWWAGWRAIPHPAPVHSTVPTPHQTRSARKQQLEQYMPRAQDSMGGSPTVQQGHVCHQTAWGTWDWPDRWSWPCLHPAAAALASLQPGHSYLRRHLPHQRSLLQGHDTCHRLMTDSTVTQNMPPLQQLVHKLHALPDHNF